MKLLSNTPTSEHGRYLREAFSRSNEAFFAVAFLKESGLRDLSEAMLGLLNRGGRITAVIGLDFFLTEPAALQTLHAFQNAGRFELFLFQQSSETFHPKYYRFRSDLGKEVVVGSANLTTGGLLKNVETSVATDVAPDSVFGAECDKYESELLALPRCLRATLIAIELYRRQFDAWHVAVAAGVKEARERIKSIGATTIIDSYLAAYRQDQKEALDLDRRKRNYVQAKVVLHDIADATKLDENEFRRLYELLVGAAGQKGLWHSGGLMRQKNFVISEHRRVHSFISDMAANTALTPKAIFALGSRRRDGITGLGPNVMTEIFNALAPDRFPVLNNNPLTGLKELGFGIFPSPALFSPSDYERYTNALGRLRDQAGFSDFGETDHFLNFIYWKLAKPNDGRPAASYATA